MYDIKKQFEINGLECVCEWNGIAKIFSRVLGRLDPGQGR